jgi:hypothetical protein
MLNTQISYHDCLNLENVSVDRFVELWHTFITASECATGTLSLKIFWYISSIIIYVPEISPVVKY